MTTTAQRVSEMLALIRCWRRPGRRHQLWYQWMPVACLSVLGAPKLKVFKECSAHPCSLTAGAPASGGSGCSVVPIDVGGTSAVLRVETDAVAKAIADFMAVVPAEMIYHKASVAPQHERSANLRKAMTDYSAGQVRKGTVAAHEWVKFCATNRLANLALPADGDTIRWSLRDGGQASEARNAGKRSQDGQSWEHDTACALRWLASIGLPFDAAGDVAIRKASKQKLSREPAFAEMWEVAVVVHLLRVALRYAGPGAAFVRPCAAAAFCVAWASLRLVDGLRSRPPCVEVFSPSPQGCPR